MKICKECGGIAEWNSYYGGITCTRCGYVEIPKPTNYNRLIGKSPEEMAAFLADHPVVSDYDARNPQHREWLDWLMQEANEMEFSS